ncbi:MAG TPA: CDF family Co(II)/Ni(II) efflux transporter DmeF [Steroidobacteraceae bacterium]|nr:CDF family Co(II)/Ni(II) efflux transporter DmeF [Steroidobacteraceae bacterium]
MDAWRHSHVFDRGNPLAERNTRRVAILTAVVMAIEIVAGWRFNSMALLADGWHMSSHAVALGLSAFAYVCARRFADNPRFAFGTWKIEILGGYTSAVLLMGVALAMFYASTLRLITPSPIQYNAAIAVACVGLAVNILCAWWLRGGQHHGNGDSHLHTHDHGPVGKDHHHHRDLNLRSAYLHVVADAATSVFAISALVGGKLWGARWLDPVMGIVGGGLVAVWAYSLLRETGQVLLDAEMNAPIVEEIRTAIRTAPMATEICDLHVWRVGKGKYACLLSLASPEEITADDVKSLLSVHDELVHITVEINRVDRPHARSAA